MTNQPPLNPDALWKKIEVFCENMAETGQMDRMEAIDLLIEAQNYLAVAQPVVNSVDYLSTPEGHYSAWLDTNEGYTQRKGWTITCLWCRAEFTGGTKREALVRYHTHEESILQKLREADAEQAKNRPEVNDA